MILRPRLLLKVGVVLVVLLTGLDVAARVISQDELAGRAKTATGAQQSSASISGFPFLWDLLVDGSVSGAHLHLSDVPVGTLTLKGVDVRLTDTSIDRGALFGQRQVKVTAVASADASVTVTAAELSKAIGDTVTLPGSDEVLVDVAGRPVAAHVRVVDGHLLEVSAGGLVLLSSDLATSPLVPTCGFAVSLGAGQLTVSCHVAPVPVRLIDAVAGS